MYSPLEKKTNGGEPIYEIREIDGCPVLYYRGQPAHEHDWQREGGEAHRVSFDHTGALRYTRAHYAGLPRMWASAIGEPPPQSDTPALDAYMRRIGAEQRNFRRYVVREATETHYFRDKYIVTLDSKGTVTARETRGGDAPDEIRPTASEQEAIAAECASAEWPKSILASDAQVDMLEERLGFKPTLFIFRSKDREGVLLVQQRIDKEDGTKADLPWTMWSDGEWRCMEPDGLLPLYGLDRLSEGGTVFVHEGASVPGRLQPKVDAFTAAGTLAAEKAKLLDDCPWLPELCNAVHLGWPGGAPNPHRVDWSPIRELPRDARIVLVCDNDAVGENAAPAISRTLQRPLKMIRFGAAFKRGFDLADAFPTALFEERKTGGAEAAKVYTGPALADCIEPATWATSGKDKLRSQFVEEWHFTVRPAVFVNKANLQRRYDPDEFNVAVAPFADAPNVVALLRKVPSAKAETIVYEPGHPPGRISFGGAQVINIYQPPAIRPRAGDVTMFMDYLAYLVPDEQDRAHLMKWCATLIARPDVRMSYGVLLISHTQGVGKTTLSEKILVPLLGLSNCSFPTPKMAVDSQFNSWIAFKRLAVIAEIYDGHTAKAYNTLKATITDDLVPVNEKYEKSFTIRNHIHVVASSNSFRALKIDDQDRRWFVPGVTEEAHKHEYWAGFNEWLRLPEALPAVAHWAVEYVKEHGPVLAGAHAPTSAAKRRSINEGRSDGERLIHELGEDMMTLARDGEARRADGRPVRAGRHVVVRLDEVRSWLATKKAVLNHREYGDDGKRMLESPERIASVLRGCGLYFPGRQFRAEGDRFRIVANVRVDDACTSEQVLGCLYKCHEVKELAGREEPM